MTQGDPWTIPEQHELPPEQRRRENREATVFLVGLLVLALGIAWIDFPFYTWVIELACCVVYVAIFMFAFSIREYSSDSTALVWGISFLFTFAFEVFYFYVVARSGAPDFRLATNATYLWVCTQWFQAFSFLIVLRRNRAAMSTLTVAVVCAGVSIVLGAFAVVAPQLVTWAQTQGRLVYLGGNLVAFTVFYGFLTVSLVRHWNEQPSYFATRSLVSVLVSWLACLGLALTVDAGPVVLFAFSFLRFVALAVCYNANVTYTLLSPYRSLYGKLVEHARDLEDKVRNNTELKDALELLHRTQEKLVESAKLSASGQIIAGISHDLNTPLAAIQSASGMLRITFRERKEVFGAAWDSLDAAQRGVFHQVVAELLAEDVFLDTRAERQAQQTLRSLAATSQHPQAEAVSQFLVDAGLGSRHQVFAQLLTLNDPLPVARALEPVATMHQLAAVIHEASGRASQVVIALRTFLRGGTEGERQSLDVKASIEEVLPLFQPQRLRGLTLSAHLEPAQVMGWSEKLAQVWVNLLTNAVQATGPQGWVEIRMNRVAGKVLVAVENQGPEIPQDIRDRIFEVFFTTKGPGEGTGLGLYVCRRIVGELGGDLTLESRPGRTVFTVELPLA